MNAPPRSTLRRCLQALTHLTRQEQWALVLLLGLLLLGLLVKALRLGILGKG